MNNIPDRQAVCDVLMEEAKTNKDIVVLCSDARGSSSMTAFADTFPDQFVETGIAEQDLVSIAAGLARCGKKAYAASPASFISTRSYEQVKVDVAYSNTNVKLIGVSGGVSYGALGMTHHSAQDIAAMCAIPNMRVYLPSDRFQTANLIKALLEDEKPAYIRVGRGPVEDIYTEDDNTFVLNHASVLRKGDDAVIIACGEMVKKALDAADILNREGIKTTVIDMYCLKLYDEPTTIQAAAIARLVVTVEEHSPFGGLGAITAQVLGKNCPTKLINISLPDAPVMAGTSDEIFDHYGMNAEGIVKTVRGNLT